ncbi:MAG: hypothetical protein LAT82_04320 [Nanoarchaeota archaeon]|nr:hypothetical protein [Nanoarchaeota archaeon]
MKQYIQELYTKKEFFTQAQEFFNQEGFIQLQEFFNQEQKEVVSSLTSLNLIPQETFSLNYSPLIHKKFDLDYSKISNLKIESIELIEFFKSKTFEEYLEQLTGFSIQFTKTQISKFNHSCFELIHDSKVTDSMLLDIYFFITKDEFEQEMGGHKVYTTFEEELFYINPTHNSLTCVFRDEELRTYTKYINSLAKEKEYIQIHTTFEILGSLEEDLV